MATTPLAVLDLVPITSGCTAAEALRCSIDLAQQAERLGYARYWFAEHHLNPGVAGTSPAVVLRLTAAAPSRIRIGSGAVQMGHRTALATVEEFGLIDALYPGRLDLGLGRSGGKPPGGSGASKAPPEAPRTTPSRSTTCWPCCGARTSAPTAPRLTSCRVRAPTCRSGSWAAAAAR